MQNVTVSGDEEAAVEDGESEGASESGEGGKSNVGGSSTTQKEGEEGDRASRAKRRRRVPPPAKRPIGWLPQKPSPRRYAARYPQHNKRAGRTTYKCCVYECGRCANQYALCNCDYQCGYVTDKLLPAPSREGECVRVRAKGLPYSPPLKSHRIKFAHPTQPCVRAKQSINRFVPRM